MTRYILRRLMLLGITLLMTSMLVFGLTQLLPGDVARINLGRDATTEQLEAFRQTHGLDQPVINQYINWLTGFITGDWGKSFNRGSQPIRPLVMQKLGNTLRLAALTLVIAVPLSVLLGVIAALKEDTWVDSAISVTSLAVVGLPEFVTGVVLVQVFANQLGWFKPASFVPRTGNLADWLEILILPAITATLVLLAYVSRMTRAGVIDELKKSYVRTARLKGLPEYQVIFKHVLRNALLPTITVIALSVGWLIGGLVVVEDVFSYPGIGSELVAAVEQQNIPLLQAIVMLIIFFYAMANLMADILYSVLNPRIRLN